ncbi:MAG: anion permease, partial [Chloroflexota bacterium]|nr:anion permease [Chloroflexota bacterium]
PGGIEGHLRALPEKLLWSRPRLVRLLADCCVAEGKLEQAVDTYREAERRGLAARNGDVAREYHAALVGLYERLGREEERTAAQRRLEHLMDAGDDAARGGRERGTAQLLMDEVPREAAEEWRWPDGVVRFAGLCHGAVGALVTRCEERGISWRVIATLVVIALTGAAWFLPPLPGLSPEATRVLASMGALVVLSFLDVLPEYLLGLLLIGAWVVTGTLPAPVATAGFASPTFFLMVASMAIGAAVERSGLLYRGAIELVRRLPPSHAVRCATLGTLGALFSLGIPSIAGRIMLALPLVQDISDALRYKDRSGGSAGLALSAYVGFGMLGTLFLTGTPNALILWGLLPPESQARMNWGMWFVAALPTHAILLGMTLAFILFRYRPEREDSPPEETIALQRRVLGGLRRPEWSVLGCLALLVLGLSTQALHGVDPAWIAVAAVVALFVTGALDDGTFREGVNVSFLVYVGVIIGFGVILAHVELDAWLGGMLGSLTGLTGGSQLLFIGGVGLVSIALALALRPGPIAILLALALFGPAQSVGVDAWVVVLAVSLATNIWVYPQQNLLYLTAFYATGERAFSHEQARPLALAYPLFVLVALLASVPYWRWLGLLQ